MLQLTEDLPRESYSENWKATPVALSTKLPTLREVLPCCGFTMSYNPNSKVASFFYGMRNSLTSCPHCKKKYSLNPNV